jgi:hypothetical protein
VRPVDPLLKKTPRYAVAGPEASYACSGLLDRTDAIGEGNQGPFELGIVDTLDERKIAVIEGSGFEANEHFARGGFGFGAVREHEIVDAEFLNFK